MMPQNTEKRHMAHEALDRAESGQSLANYPAIIEGFSAKGIPEAEILPRQNVLTFHAWRAKGRTVKRGEHGVKVGTYVTMTKKETDAEGRKTEESFKRPRSATVFHVSQTKELGAAS